MTKRNKSTQVAIQQLEQKLTKEEKAKLEVKPATGVVEKAKKVFAGFVTKLIYKTESLNIETDCRYEKLDAKKIVEARLQVEHRLVDGTPVYNRPDVSYHYGWFNTEESTADQKQYQEGEVKHFQKLPDGSETEISEFKRVGDPKKGGRPIEVAKNIPSVETDKWIVEAVYQLWSDNIPALQQIAEDLQRKDEVAYFPEFSFGGYQGYHAFIQPVFDQKGNFQLQMSLARIKKTEAMTRMMPINGKSLAEETAKPKAKTAQQILTEL